MNSDERRWEIEKFTKVLVNGNHTSTLWISLSDRAISEPLAMFLLVSLFMLLCLVYRFVVNLLVIVLWTEHFFLFALFIFLEELMTIIYNLATMPVQHFQKNLDAPNSFKILCPCYSCKFFIKAYIQLKLSVKNLKSWCHKWPVLLPYAQDRPYLANIY